MRPNPGSQSGGNGTTAGGNTYPLPSGAGASPTRQCRDNGKGWSKAHSSGKISNMPPLMLYNTLNRKLEPFKPRSGKHVGLYACGPTVYSTAHVGNLRTYIFEDILRRTLEFNGFMVKHVMNVTDVGHLTSNADDGEDKIEAAAKQQHRSAIEIARRHEREFFSDLKRLNIEPPTKILRATETIDLQIDLIKVLENKDVTYRISDGIYFDTTKFPRYGQLSGQKTSDKKAGARVAVRSDKKHPADFALWKFSKPEDKRQMEWPSPWGTGFPGWHIECSAMSMKELGDQFDIHTGGVDHIAVHHENEIAQSEAATGNHPFVKYWLHGEFLVTDKRMGKSEGNAITLQQVIDKGIDPLAFRYLCLQTHYRKPLSFTWESLIAAQSGLDRLWNLITNWTNEAETGKTEKGDRFITDFQSAISDDLNTPRAMQVLHTMLASSETTGRRFDILKDFDRVLALDLNPEAAKEHITPVGSELEKLLKDYETARREKRFSDSDIIRKEFAAKGIIVEDSPDGTSRLRKE